MGWFAVAGTTRTFGADSPRLQIHQTEEATFPRMLIAQGITSGEAWILISIDAGGRLTDALVSRYTQRPFADEALRVIRLWRFEPVLIEGRPTAVCTQVKFSFQATGCIVTLDTLTAMQRLMDRDNPRWETPLCDAAELDRMPEPLNREASLTGVGTPATSGPSALAGDGARRVVIEFIIDETGRPRMPVLISAPDPAFGNHAVALLETWRFTPPTRRGVPVSVRVRQEFVFRPDL